MRKIVAVVFFMVVSACQPKIKWVTTGALTIPFHPQAGTSIRIRYAPGKGTIVGEPGLQMTFYYTVGQLIYAEDVALSDSGKTIHTTVILPDSAQAFALKFHARHTDRNGGRGYVFPLYDAQGKPLEGALAGVSLFYNTRQSLLRLSQQPDTALMLMQREFRHFPKEKKNWMDLYLKTLLQADKKEAYQEVQATLDNILTANKISDKDYHLAYHLFSRMGKKTKADSVKREGLRKFPDGQLAKYDALKQFNDQEDIDSLLMYYQQFKRRFHVRGTPDDKTMRMQDLMGSRIALYYAKQGHYKAYLKMVSEIKSPLEKASDYINVATSLLGTGQRLALADSLMKVSLPLIRIAMNVPRTEKPTYITKKAWKRRMRRSYGLNADTYALILSKEGKIKGAIGYQRIAVGLFGGRKKDINERYINYLIADKDYNLAEKQIKRFISRGMGTSQMREQLKTMNRHK